MKTAGMVIEDERVEKAIAAVEARTSGEVRVVIAAGETDDPVALARMHFERLKMMATPQRNGVLILVAPRSRKFAVIGDQGIHDKCGPAFWEEVAAAMGAEFKAEHPTAALELGIRRVGTLLAQHFPKTPDDPNSLPDTVHRG